jgi:hypothetical protein
VPTFISDDSDVEPLPPPKLKIDPKLVAEPFAPLGVTPEFPRPPPPPPMPITIIDVQLLGLLQVPLVTKKLNPINLPPTLKFIN